MAYRDLHAPRSWWRRPRLRYALAAFLLGVVYSGVAMALGLDIRLGTRDLTLFVGVLIELSFAGFGFLIGFTIEASGREREAAQQVQAQLEALAAAQVRLGACAVETPVARKWSSEPKFLADLRHIVGLRNENPRGFGPLIPLSQQGYFLPRRLLAQQEKLASLGQLAGAVAHEVRNPLAILRSLVQNLGETLPAANEDGHQTGGPAVRGCQQQGLCPRCAGERALRSRKRGVYRCGSKPGRLFRAG